jgi:hypothetical protein
MKSVLMFAPLALAVALCSGCGSSGFHSATHDYSVHQVQAAFAAHGMELRRTERKEQSRIVALSSDKVGVYVAPTVPLAKPSRVIPHYSFLLGPITVRKHGNVLVVFKSMTPTRPIDAALADLH